MSRLSNRRLFIYCAGGQGREALKTAHALNQGRRLWDEILFIDDGAAVSSVNGAKVIPFSTYLKTFRGQDDGFHIAAGEPALREKIAKKLLEKGKKLESIICPSVSLSSYCVVGEGVFIGEGVTLSDNLIVGECACLNANAAIGHNAVIGDYATVSPGAIISGNTRIGKGTYIGAGAIIRDEVTIGQNSIIGMGSLVTKDITAGVVAYGSPCKVIRENKDGIVFR